MTNKTSNLNLEASAGASSSSTFELTSLGTDVRLSVGTRHTRGTEMLNGLTGVLLSTKKDSVLSSGSSASQLVESEGLTPALTILLLAVSENRRAQTFKAGSSRRRGSFKTVPTITAMLSSLLPFIWTLN